MATTDVFITPDTGEIRWRDNDADTDYMRIIGDNASTNTLTVAGDDNGNLVTFQDHATDVMYPASNGLKLGTASNRWAFFGTTGDFSGALTLGTASSLVFSGSTSGTITFSAPAVAGTQTYTWPTGHPAGANYVLTSTTGGVMSWAALNGPATPDTSVQFNNSGVFGGSSDFTWNNTNKTLTLAGANTSNISLIASKTSTTTTSNVGAQLLAATAATAGTPIHYSPGLEFAGRGWNLGSSADNVARFREEVQPSSSLAVTGVLVWKSSVDTGTPSFTNRMTLNTSGQLAIPTTGSNAGILIGGDTQIYRSNSDELRTPDSLVVDSRGAFGTSLASDAQLVVARTVSTDTHALGIYGSLTITGPSTTGAGSFPKAGQFFTFLQAGSNAVSYCAGVFGSVRDNSSQSGAVGEVYGFDYDVWKSGSANWNIMAGSRSFVTVRSGSTGTISNMLGYRAVLDTENASIASVTTAIGFDFVPNFQGTMSSFSSLNGVVIRNQSVVNSRPTNYYGIRFEDLTFGTNNYGIYFEGTSGLARQGIWWNGDTNLYRSAADTLKTDDAFIGNTTITAGTGITITTGDLTMSSSTGGVRLNATDRPLITRAWDAFTSGTYNGIGRWGLYQEAHTLVLGFPNVASKGLMVKIYNADSSGTCIAYFSQNAKVGIGSTFSSSVSPTYDLSFTGTAGKTIGMERNTSFSGNSLTIRAGGAASGATNMPGGSLVLMAGTSTGSSTGGSIQFQISGGGSSGTSDISHTTKLIVTLDSTTFYTRTTQTINPVIHYDKNGYDNFCLSPLGYLISGHNTASNRMRVVGNQNIDALDTPTDLFAEYEAESTSYGYKVVALSGTGVSLASAEYQFNDGPNTLGGGKNIFLSWTAVPGADSYKVYGRTQGNTLFMATVGTPSFEDDGSITPSGAITTENTTGRLGINVTAPLAMLHAVSYSATIRTAIFKGASSQSANLVEIRKSDDTVYVAWDSSGNQAFDGNIARTVSVNRHTTSNTAGNDLTITAGGATSGATNKAGGHLVLRAGQNTGSGISKVQFYTPAAGGASTTDGTQTLRAEFDQEGLNMQSHLKQSRTSVQQHGSNTTVTLTLASNNVQLFECTANSVTITVLLPASPTWGNWFDVVNLSDESGTARTVVVKNNANTQTLATLNPRQICTIHVSRVGTSGSTFGWGVPDVYTLPTGHS